jgi:hypothetical protein
MCERAFEQEYQKHYYKVETWCPFIADMVILTVETDKPMARIITGKPIECNKKAKCQETPKCLLQAIEIQTRR